MGILLSPAHAFVRTRVHNVVCLCVRMTLKMMKRMDDYYSSYPKCDNYDDITVDDNNDDSNYDDEDIKRMM